MPNDDLISRKALLDSFDVHKVTEYDEAGFAMSYNAVPVEVIEKAPAVDAKPVRHGWWKGKPIAGLSIVKCSACGMAFCNNTGRWLYCPNCGAKMDLKEDG